MEDESGSQRPLNRNRGLEGVHTYNSSEKRTEHSRAENLGLRYFDTFLLSLSLF